MIQIQRPKDGPTNLKRLGQEQTRRDCAAYDLCPSDYSSGKAIFSKRTYYSDKDIKDVLVRICNSKCCYCERKCWSYYDLDVEHFRPSGGVRQALDQQRDELPGYYWLIYEWKNLLLSCAECNRRYKKTFFPLANPTERARSHHDPLARERPLLVDPDEQNPRDHIRFDGSRPIGISEQGRVTIEAIGLQHNQGLQKERADWLIVIDTFYDFLELAKEQPDSAKHQEKAQKARELIEAAKRPDAKFSSMVIDYVAGLGL